MLARLSSPRVQEVWSTEVMEVMEDTEDTEKHASESCW